jgi:hypothetical protein
MPSVLRSKHIRDLIKKRKNELSDKNENSSDKNEKSSDENEKSSDKNEKSSDENEKSSDNYEAAYFPGHDNKYIRQYTDAQKVANRAKVAPKGTGEAMYAAAEKGEAAELLNLVEPWFANPVLNEYSGFGRFGWDSTPLLIASKKGHIECVRVLVAQPGIELNKVDRDNERTALYCASYFGHVDIVELLCSQPGIDVNKENTYHYTPHSVACAEYSGPDKEERRGKIKAILEAKDPLAKYRRSYADTQIAANKDKKAREGTGEAIYGAAYIGDAAELLRLVKLWFANPVLNDYSGHWTPLVGASVNGHIECVKILAAQPGIELNKGDRNNQSTALLCASSNGHVDIVELLCSQPAIDVNKADKNGDTPYSIACHDYKGVDKEERTRKIRAILKKKNVPTYATYEPDPNQSDDDEDELEKAHMLDFGTRRGGKRKRTYKKRPKKTKKGRSRKHK